MSQLAALEREMDAAKRELAGGSDATRIIDLKTRRDQLRRAVKSGTIWSDSGSF